MKLYIKRHRLLKLLSKHRNNVIINNPVNSSLGVTFEDIYKDLNCTEKDLYIITSELYISDEIGYHDANNIVGLYVKEKGVSAFSNRKYINILYDKLINILKNIVQIFIPILSLIIAYVALTTKTNNLKKLYEKELQEVKKELKEQKLYIESLKTSNNQNLLEQKQSEKKK
mgnify:FL=1